MIFCIVHYKLNKKKNKENVLDEEPFHKMFYRSSFASMFGPLSMKPREEEEDFGQQLSTITLFSVIWLHQILLTVLCSSSLSLSNSKLILSSFPSESISHNLSNLPQKVSFHGHSELCCCRRFHLNVVQAKFHSLSCFLLRHSFFRWLESPRRNQWAEEEHLRLFRVWFPESDALRLCFFFHKRRLRFLYPTHQGNNSRKQNGEVSLKAPTGNDQTRINTSSSWAPNQRSHKNPDASHKSLGEEEPKHSFQTS